jgi:SpoVK/Ycf46/Vps4 family AAA+-type ATPase
MSGLTPRDLRAFAADAGAFAVSRVMKENGDSLEDEDPCAEEQEDEESLLCSADVVPKEDIEHLPVVIQRDDGDKVCKEAGNEMSVTEPEKQRSSMQKSQHQFQVRVEDLEKALERMKVRTASAIGTPKVPNVKWEDVGGLEDVKKAILDTVQLPLVHRELFASGLRQRSGVLLYGPPGTGKVNKLTVLLVRFKHQRERNS